MREPERETLFAIYMNFIIALCIVVVVVVVCSGLFVLRAWHGLVERAGVHLTALSRPNGYISVSHLYAV